MNRRKKPRSVWFLLKILNLSNTRHQIGMLVSDEDVFNATVSTLKIFDDYQNDTNTRSLYRLQNPENKYEPSDSSAVVSSSGSDLSESCVKQSLSSFFERNISYPCLKKNLEFQNALESLGVINLMYNYYHKEKSRQEQNETAMQSFMNVYADIMMPSKIREKVEKIKIVLDHITLISKEGAKLRQALRSNALDEFWKINVDHHRCIINFFNLAQEITKDIQEFISSIEKCKEHNPDRLKNLHILETNLLAELHENLDLLTKFRSYVQTKLNFRA